MFDVFIFTDIEMPFIEKKGALCIGVYSITVELDCAPCICEGVLKAVASSNADLDMALKIQRGRLFVLEKMISITKNITRQMRVFVKKSCKAQRCRYEEPRFLQLHFGASRGNP